MLTDTALRNLKPKSLIYKASDCDGMYVTVSPAGTVTFRYDSRLSGRRETLTIGRYGPAGISLAMAQEKLLDVKRAVARASLRLRTCSRSLTRKASRTRRQQRSRAMTRARRSQASSATLQSIRKAFLMQWRSPQPR